MISFISFSTIFLSSQISNMPSFINISTFSFQKEVDRLSVLLIWIIFTHNWKKIVNSMRFGTVTTHCTWRLLSIYIWVHNFLKVHNRCDVYFFVATYCIPAFYSRIINASKILLYEQYFKFKNVNKTYSLCNSLSHTKNSTS